MPDGLPSIEDLLKQQKPAASAPAATSAQQKPTKTSTDAVEDTKEELLTEKLKKVGEKSLESETEQEAQTLGVGYIALKGFPISPDALTLIPEAQSKELQVISFLHTGPELRIGATNPKDQKVKDLVFQIEERNKTNAALYKISEQSFNEGFKLYAMLPKIIKTVKGVQIKEEELAKYQASMETLADIATVLKGASVTDIIAIVIAASLKLGSSDIHIEAEEKGIVVRFRVDGILQDVTTLDKDLWKKIINRIKLIAGLKININDTPQDGRYTIYQKGKKIDVRTSTMPTAWGESVVMRILNPDSVQLGFEKLGFRDAMFKRLEREISKPHGMIITTGPTGSGKTTTLYAILSRLNKPGVKIITLEDPVEYKVEGLNQSQIDHSKDYTFAKGLRSILRQDPDIVMVGEIRDLETAETAIQAALTGHLLLSTIHTNDAAGAVPRFIAMGVKPFLLAPAVNAIMGQRLARRLCPDCKKPAELDAETLARVKELLDSIPENSGEAKPDTANIKLFTGVGCANCTDGYKGRVGLYEVLVKDAEIEKFILSGQASEYEMREIASKQGMINMSQDGLLKALEGLTSVDEIKRVTGL